MRWVEMDYGARGGNEERTCDAAPFDAIDLEEAADEGVVEILGLGSFWYVLVDSKLPEEPRGVGQGGGRRFLLLLLRRR